MKSIKRVLLTLFIVHCSLLIVKAQIYVDADATGNANGTSWSDAYVYLQDALAAASGGDEIWVADGTYYPDEGASQTDGSRTTYFTLVDSVSLYGGFNGIETSKYQASPTANVTILSGDIDKDGTSDNDNSYHVVYANSLSGKVTIDGFSIQYGYANGSSDTEDGSAFYNYETADYLTISNCTFENNYADRRGAVLNDVGSGASLTTTFLNCIFKNNTSKSGGAVHNYGQNASGECAPQFINCLFYNNTATVNGGAFFSWAGSNGASNPVLTNCTFYNNSGSAGGAFRNSNYSHLYLTNCIVWQNGSDEWSNNTYGYITITNSIVNLSSYPTNTTDGGNNSNSDPLFEDAANEDFRLQSSSPAKDAGTNSADLDGSGSGTSTIEAIAMDLQGLPRLDEENETVDIGAYERPRCECNEIMGTNAGASLTTGVGNSIYGEEAGVSLTTGSFNSLMGYGVGYSLTSADSSVMVGYQAGYNTTTGSKNIFVGSEAGYSNTVGYNNYYIGTKAGYANTTGYNNIGIGEEAGATITTGFNNIIIGEQAYFSSSDKMTGRDNIFIGNDKDHCTSGSYNIMIGAEENHLTTGNYNVFYGFGAGEDNSSGSWNTFLGTEAGNNTEYASYNTFIGSFAGWDNNRTNKSNTSNYNTYIGDSCGYHNREGEYNVGIGADATPKESSSYNYSTYIGADIYFENGSVSLLGYGAEAYGAYGIGIGAYSNIQKAGGIGMGYETYLNGQYAVGIGYQDTISANYGISIGYQANVADKYGIAIGKNATSSSEYSIALGSGASATGYNSAAIGYGASVSGNHEIVFGNTSTTTIGGTVDFTALSDGRFKTDVREDVVGLGFIRKLRPVTYNLKAQASDAFKASDAYTRYSGFIAQEVEQAAHQVGFDFSGIDYRKEIDKYGLRYAEFVVPLVKSIQELQPKIEKQQEIIQQQDARLDAYKAELLQLAAEVQALEQQ